ncbi:glucose 1-dehydrogenase [Methanocorpusculum sp. MG]|uniref:Glucose 1-dehydrogenase n=1 Tax=Methanocorpusculum petauri TaxID=3002863 RepID=A0ABT4IHE0_9EURY|nr:glucose 1-dehydrogenase [Methanocorpusculum petauri]MCZ0861161.1 glucose 1-dehydrogenase [Methanocorpusculum petauri]MDE2442844.1 glucose 1-dehydrogenase [Methanocorpusculum sp.]
MKFSGKVAVVTGAAKGIGRSVALLFAENGAKVAVVDIDETEGTATAADINKAGGKACFIRCDVGCESDILQMIAEVTQTFGTIDILVNDAALQLNKGLLETTAEEFRHVMDVNVTGTFLCTREAAKHMIAQNKGGAIINFSSTFAVVGSSGYLAYHASKGAIASLTRAAAVALLPYGIRVNAVAPGTTETPGLYDGARDTGDLQAGLAGFLALQPLKRFGRPDEIAKIVLMLASDDASFVYGAVWMADGAYTIV